MSQPAETRNYFLDPTKFRNPEQTASGETRAHVTLKKLETLWINTGTLCNLTCRNCYIESSPSNDRLEYIRHAEVTAYLDEIAQEGLGTHTIAFTGGEPFLNPDMLAILETTLARGFDVLVLTNATRPMLRPRIKRGLLALNEDHGERLTLRVSIDHFDPAWHEHERGAETFEPVIEGLQWLTTNGFNIDIAGRLFAGDDEATMRAGYAALFAARGIQLDAQAPNKLVLFPEMDARLDVPEITTGCWDKLGTHPDAMMCASSRMIVKRKGAEQPSVIACTLLPYDERFELGHRLSDAQQTVALNHPHCAQFCVLGGASCSG
ncbi:radical SAM protein [Spiribacter insolitus]|uniref:Radical SAM protein n=1 Tax=Spiribacter insolitus TaxID=3122417 RepID=A0ABV3T6A2_9GAMM